NLGATMYWCVTGQHIPTLIPKQENTLQRVDQMEIKPPMEINKEVPIALNNLLLHCLKSGTHERPQSMTEVAARLRISRTQIEQDWSKEDLIEQFTAAYERRDIERATQLLRLLDQNLTPQEAEPYMEMAREVLAHYKEETGRKFKEAVANQQWIEALNIGEQIMRHFPNSAFADEVKKMMRSLQRRASAAESSKRGTAV
ncbi:MAG: hypothetical protein R3236_05095, partial [Phycisphaeraceae bacterium]|nr:hypothetical protein [Phycisphaeraceae bacterium]